MAKLKRKFNAKKANRDGGFEVFPAGDYKAHLAKSEVKKSKNTGNEYLAAVFVILEGKKYKGRMVFHNFNLWNDNETAVEIAEREFALFCDAVGHGREVINDTKILHKIPFILKVGVEDAKGKYPEKNIAVGYLPLKGKKKGKKKGKNKKPW
jgi:hypothetical protein